MRKYGNNIGIKVILIATFLLFCSLNLSAQYKLEFEWRKDMERIVSMTKSDNDSLLYVAFENVISTYKTSDGSIVKNDSVNGTYNLMMSRDGKTLIASSGTGVGILDPITFEKIYFDYTPKNNFRTLSFNEKSNKYLICGNTSYGSSIVSSYIKIYDALAKSLYKEIPQSYFGQHTNLVRNAWITDDNKYIIYSLESNLPLTNKSYLKIIDLDGKVVKDFGQTSSPKFTITNDGKSLIYFMSDAIHFLDIESMKEKEIVPLGGLNPARIEMSSDGKIMLLGFNENSKIINSLMYYEFATKNYFILNDNSSWGESFKLKNDNSSLFYGINNHLYKFKLTPNTSISERKNLLDLTISTINNKLILTNPQNHQINTLTVYDILGRTYPLSANGNEVDISALVAGKYFLKVGLADGSFLDFGFVVD